MDEVVRVLEMFRQLTDAQKDEVLAEAARMVAENAAIQQRDGDNPEDGGQNET